MSRYQHVKGGMREDLPGVIVRSTWEANLCRILNALQAKGYVVYWEKEVWKFEFNGAGTGPNSKVFPDFFVIWQGRKGWSYGWIEVKGTLKCGGRLTRDGRVTHVDLTTLGRDPDSRIKLERLVRHYPRVATRTFLVGQREYRILRKRYRSLVLWEGEHVKDRHSTTPPARSSRAAHRPIRDLDPMGGGRGAA